ncbi:helix-turn-helix domain-containing protein [Xanthomonas euvesicatoria]|uniref:helix-turn-helix domain-containing protein n=1 Tax=Xanthomonas euvesicatoria TaxID=456327 RepID=UPI001C43C4AA|nr:helix-turn-helix domain-containing protein [Xanthomonas campestris pv. heliotropii]
MQEKICLSVKDACATLSVGKSTFYSLVSAGHIQIFKIGKKSLIARDELTRFVAERAAEARSSHKKNARPICAAWRLTHPRSRALPKLNKIFKHPCVLRHWQNFRPLCGHNLRHGTLSVLIEPAPLTK